MLYSVHILIEYSDIDFSLSTGLHQNHNMPYFSQILHVKKNLNEGEERELT